MLLLLNCGVLIDLGCGNFLRISYKQKLVIVFHVVAAASKLKSPNIYKIMIDYFEGNFLSFSDN